MNATDTWINESLADLGATVAEAKREMGGLKLAVADLADAIRDHFESCPEVTA